MRQQLARMIYVIEAENGLFKLGNSIAPFERIEAMAAHSPCLLRIVAVWPGSIRDEQIIHADLDQFREHHEWFRKEGRAGDFFVSVFGRGLVNDPAWVKHDRATMPSRRKAIGVSVKARWSDPAYRESQSTKSGLSSARKQV